MFCTFSRVGCLPLLAALPQRPVDPVVGRGGQGGRVGALGGRRDRDLQGAARAQRHEAARDREDRRVGVRQRGDLHRAHEGAAQPVAGVGGRGAEQQVPADQGLLAVAVGEVQLVGVDEHGAGAVRETEQVVQLRLDALAAGVAAHVLKGVQLHLDEGARVLKAVRHGAGLRLGWHGGHERVDHPARPRLPRA